MIVEREGTKPHPIADAAASVLIKAVELFRVLGAVNVIVLIPEGERLNHGNSYSLHRNAASQAFMEMARWNWMPESRSSGGEFHGQLEMEQSFRKQIFRLAGDGSIWVDTSRIHFGACKVS